MLSNLQSFLKSRKLDFFILPNSDEFFSEYLPESEKRISYFSGFTGSSATIIFSEKRSYFFTDGRYILQAKNELDLGEFEIINIAEKSLLVWLEENLKKENSLGIISKLSSVNFVKSCEKIIQKNSAKLEFVDLEEFDKLWENRPKQNNSVIFSCDENLVGGDFVKKSKTILAELEVDAMLISKPENLCWLLNLRASYVEFTPLLLAYGILLKSGNVDLFVDEKRIDESAKIDRAMVNVIQPSFFNLQITALKKFLGRDVPRIQVDPNTTNHWLYELLQKNNFEIIFKTDPIELTKSCKNSAEVNSMIKAHEVDGLAVTKFLFWLQKSLKDGAEIDEISAAEKLLEFRKKHPHFLYPSFASISGFASNGAVIHYHSSTKTNKKLAEDSLYLIDSGGQYFGADFCGTTDITRTVAIGNPTPEMIENFTRVLKGHITLARVKFPVGTSGAQLDALARFHLWQAGLDYDHGTGHGVGNFLSVHEGPCGISKRAHQQLLPGMILSNEPGFYKEGEYGIRIENLMLVEKHNDKFLKFRTITLAPIDAALIDFKMLTYPEKKWLREYHEEISQKLGSDLSKEEKGWINNFA